MRYASAASASPEATLKGRATAHPFSPLVAPAETGMAINK